MSNGAAARLLSVASRAAAPIRRRLRRLSVDESGFGLIEVVIAITVLLVVLVPASYLIDVAVQQTASAKDKVTATELADQGLEQLGQDPLSLLETYLDTYHKLNSYIVAGVTYTVTSYLPWQGAGNVPDLCASGSPPQEISATAIVSWGPGHQKIAEQSVIAPSYGLAVFYLATTINAGTQMTVLTTSANTPVTISAGASLTIGADAAKSQVVTVSSSVSNATSIPINQVSATYTYDANTTAVALPDEGYIAVQVNGVTGSAPANVSSVTVSVVSTATGSTATVYTPDSNGCVYAAELPGTYNITFGSTSTPPFVTASDVPTTDYDPEIASVQVNQNATTDENITFNQAGALSFASTGSIPIAGNLPVSVGNTGISPGGWYNIIPSASA
ncbi:MAG: prepilin-type N-terminal cleavage/methylation domain-containing protein, partial [Acidimicrobiales bacterium]